MKRIFLTSGIILCMACPAFATGFDEPTVNAAFANNGTGSISGACIQDNLNSYTGPVTLTAQWTNVASVISLLDSETTYGGAATTNVLPTQLYATPTGVFITRTNVGTDQVPDYNYSSKIDLSDQDTTNDFAITQSPVGRNVAISFNLNYSQINGLNQGADYSSEITAISSQNGNRQFLGFFAESDTAGTTPLINTSRQLTSDGNTAGTTANGVNQNWVAHYGCVNVTKPTDPELTGYTFDGWYTDDTLTTAVGTNDWCFDTTNTLYAKWSQNTHKITYVCNQPGTESQTGMVPTEQTNIAYDTNITLAGNTCEFKGWTFTGWNCTYDIAGGTQPQNGQFYAVADLGNDVLFHTDANVTCTAVWDDNTIQLTWKDGTAPDGGTTLTNVGSAASCEYDSAITLPTTPTRPGYTFNGWSVTNPAPTTPQTGE